MAVVSTLGETISLAFQKLGAPDYSHILVDIKRAVHEAYALYWTDLIQSDQNQVVKATTPITFVTNQLIYSLAAVTDMTIPDWVEIQWGTLDSDWRPVSLVNRDSLSMFQTRSELACSIYGHITGNAIVNQIEFSYIPIGLTGSPSNRQFRIWYDPFIVVNTTDTAASPFPPQFNYLMATVAVIKVIPILIQRIIETAEEEKTDKAILSAKLSALNSLLSLSESERLEWDKKFRNWSQASRLNQGGRRKRYVLDVGYL